MHQNQRLAALDEFGCAENVLPVANSFPQEMEKREFCYACLGFQYDGSEPAHRHWSTDNSIDGMREFSTKLSEPLGQKLQLAPARPHGGAQTGQIEGIPIIESAPCLASKPGIM